ncbi:MAG: hypothetical protein ABFD86_11760 [Bryobacteraceae bacterium]
MDTLIVGAVCLLAIAGVSFLVRFRIQQNRRSRRRAKLILEMFA